MIRTPIKSIRKFCLECMNGSYKEIRLCESYSCPLHAYRMGKRPSSATIDAIKSKTEITT